MTRGYMKDDIGYSIILLSKGMGLLAIEYLISFMVNFIETIKMARMPLDQATTLSEKLCEQLGKVKGKKRFYMNSYMLYFLAARVTNYPSLYKRGSMQDPNAQPYIVDPQLVRKKLLAQSKEYRIMNDTFIFVVI